VLNSIFPLYVLNHSLQYWSTFLYLLFIILLLLIIVYNNVRPIRANGMIIGERRNGKNLEESRRCRNRDTEIYLQVRIGTTKSLNPARRRHGQVFNRSQSNIIMQIYSRKKC
jgi:ABC-type iron transport system FetAB permease component